MYCFKCDVYVDTDKDAEHDEVYYERLIRIQAQQKHAIKKVVREESWN